MQFADLKRQYLSIKEEIDSAVFRVLESGHYVLGTEVEEFERQIAEYCGVKHAVGVASGADALYLSLRALGVGPGDEVITSPFTMIASAEVIDRCGATPVFADWKVPQTLDTFVRLDTMSTYEYQPIRQALFAGAERRNFACD